MLYKKIIATLLVVTMLFAVFSTFVYAESESKLDTSTQASPNQKVECDNIYTKLHIYLNEDNSEQYHTIDSESELDLALSNMQSVAKRMDSKILLENNVNITVEFYSGFGETNEFQTFRAEREQIKSNAELRDFRSRLNSFSKQYHAKIMSEYLSLLSPFKYSGIDVVDYSPYAIMEMKYEEIYKNDLVNLAINDDVINIFIETTDTAVEYTAEDGVASYNIATASQGTIEYSTWDEMLQHIGARDIVTSGTYTGEGVRIGVLEAVGDKIYDVNNANLVGKDITILTPSNEVNSHATTVLSVAALIAPDAKYYYSSFLYVVDIPSRLELLVDACCDIINMSFTTTANGYAPTDGIIDYYAYYCFVTIVSSAGTNADVNAAITTPGYGFNMITVGGVVQTSSNELIHDPNARYGSEYPINKPNISAINRIIIPNGNPHGTMGTSIGAPQVTACIAVMAEYMIEERSYSITLFPETIMAILTATASKTDDYSNDFEFFDDKVGAGLINLERMISNETVINNHTFEDAYEGMVYTPTAFTLEAGQELQLSISVLADVEIDGDAYSSLFTDYDILIYPFMGSTVLASSGFIYDSNVEFIRYTATTTETIRITIKANEDCVHSYGIDYIAWSYCIVD